MFATQLNALIVQSVNVCEHKGREFIRLICKSQVTDSKGYTPSYTLMVWSKEIIDKVKELEVGYKLDAYCKCTIFLNKENDAQDISYTLLDFVPSVGITTVDKSVILQRVIITKINREINKDNKPYYKITGFSEQDNILCNFNINAFNEYVVSRIEKMKLAEKSTINCSARIAPFPRVRKGKTYQDYSYILQDLEFAEHKKKEENNEPEKNYSPTEKEWNLDDFDIFKRAFTEKL